MDGQYKDAEQLLSRAVQLVRSRRRPDISGARAPARRRNAEAQPYLFASRGQDSKVWDYHYWLAGRLKVVGYVRSASGVPTALQLNQDKQRSEVAAGGLEAK